MKVNVIIDQSYAYSPECSSVGLAIRRACDMHDRFAKQRQKDGFQAPRTIAQMARKGQVRIFATVARETSPGASQDTKKRIPRVKRGPIR
jgi:hypothetical protein